LEKGYLKRLGDKLLGKGPAHRKSGGELPPKTADHRPKAGWVRGGVSGQGKFGWGKTVKESGQSPEKKKKKQNPLQ